MQLILVSQNGKNLVRLDFDPSLNVLWLNGELIEVISAIQTLCYCLFFSVLLIF